MILQALCDYYERKPDLPRLGFETKAIPFVIELSPAGQVVQIEDTRYTEGKKKIARNFLVPQGVKRASGIAANLLWDNAEYVLNVTSRGKQDRVQEQHAAFKAKLDALADKTDDTGLQAVRTFLEAHDRVRLEADPLWPEILEANPVMTFRLNGDRELVCQRPSVRAVLEDVKSDAEKITCLISGEPDGFERLHTAIKGVWGAQTSGGNIVSFNKDAFNSFHKEQGANAPVGKRAAFAYTTALNYLLSKESTQRIQVGDASTVFWSEKHTDLEDTFADLFDEPPKDNPAKQTDAIKALFKASQTGALLSDAEGKTRFYVLGLAPNAARISVRFWQVGTVAEMSVRIRQHFDDLKIAHHEKLSPYLPLHSNRKNSLALLNSLVLDGDPSRVPPNLAGEFMRAILAGLPYPQTLLQAAVRRTHAESDVTYPRAALIKACLNRQARYSPPQEKEIIVALEHSITRMAVATEAEAEKQSGDNRTMGRKFTVPYGLYAAHGFVSSFLAKQTGFDEADLELLWQALAQMFEHDRSAARGEMTTRGLYVFKHDSELGNAPAHKLFERIQPKLTKDGTVPREFSDYTVTVDSENLPQGVTLERKVG